MKTLTHVAVVVAALALAACGESATAPVDDRQVIRDATRQFQQVDAAVAAGYVAAGPCVAHPTMGAMGFHYTKNSLVDGVVDLRAPEALLYVPTASGGRELVGVEYVVASATWDAANTSPPTALGRTFDDHREPAMRHGTPFPHYDLHVWIWRDNPAGMFAPFNSQAGCG